MNEKTAVDELTQARALLKALWATGIAYGDPPRLWRVAPYWYYLWERQWQEIVAFGQLLPRLRAVVDGTAEPTYLRADFTVDINGRMVLVELNGTPVWDFGTQAVRKVYHAVLGLPKKYSDPFPGAAGEIATLLRGFFGRRRILILLSPDRLRYRAEYQCLAAYFRSRGLKAEVADNPLAVSAGDLLYRTFTADWLDREGSFPGGGRLRRLLHEGKIVVWPGFTKLERKLWLACLFTSRSDSDQVFSFSDGEIEALMGFIPWTWPVDPSLPPVFGGDSWVWAADPIMGQRKIHPEKETQYQWVLKRAAGAQGVGTAFSCLLTPTEWREALLNALLSANGSEAKFVLQPEVATLRHRVSYFDERKGEMVEGRDFRLRLCVAYLVRGSEVQIIDADATLRDHPLVHGSSDAVIQPVVIRERK